MIQSNSFSITLFRSPTAVEDPGAVTGAAIAHLQLDNVELVKCGWGTVDLATIWWGTTAELEVNPGGGQSNLK
jgi:hypothetical protein